MKMTNGLLRVVLSLLMVVQVHLPVVACTTCNRPLQAAIFDASFMKILCYMLLPFLFIGVAVYRLHKLK